VLICDFCDFWRAEILAPGANWEGGRAESAKEYAQGKARWELAQWDVIDG
jgi:hypothetical protein